MDFIIEQGSIASTHKGLSRFDFPYPEQAVNPRFETPWGWRDVIVIWQKQKLHYGDVIMGAIASQITSLTIVYSIVYSDADQRKHQSSASLAFVRGIHRGPVNSPHKWPVTRKMFPFDDVIMVILVIYHRKRNNNIVTTCSCADRCADVALIGRGRTGRAARQGQKTDHLINVMSVDIANMSDEISSGDSCTGCFIIFCNKPRLGITSKQFNRQRGHLVMRKSVQKDFILHCKTPTVAMDFHKERFLFATLHFAVGCTNVGLYHRSRLIGFAKNIIR